jgi:hypothetical protein
MTKALFEYRLRENPRSRHVRLRVSMEAGLEVIVPKGYDARWVPQLLEQRKGWIQAALERAEANRKLIEPLPGIGQTWRIVAEESGSARVTVRELAPGELRVRGATHDEAACRTALARWLAERAREHLVPQLQELSRSLGFRYRDTYIRRQRTRWGSCSNRKAITLNAKLLFLPPLLVRHVMVHELCHLIEMNHSARFWALVARHDTDFRTLDKLLREAWKMVPHWAS